MVPHGPVRFSMVMFGLEGPIGSCIILYSPGWSCRALYGPLLPCMASNGPVDHVCFVRVTFGALWSLLYLLGSVRFCIVPYSPAWSHMVPPWSGKVEYGLLSCRALYGKICSNARLKESKLSK